MRVINEDGEEEGINITQAFLLANERVGQYVERMLSDSVIEELNITKSRRPDWKILFRVRSTKGWMMTLEKSCVVAAKPFKEHMIVRVQKEP